MKLENSSNYTIFVRPQSIEEDEAVARWYEGIYFVTLNQQITMHFVPWTAAFAQPTVHLPNDLDAPTSQDEARLWVSGYADYIVTYRDEDVGASKKLAVTFENSNETHQPVLYFVSQDAFALYIQELQQLATQLTSVHDYKRYDAVQHLDVINYLEKTVLASVWITPRYFEILKRPFPHLISQTIHTVIEYNRTHTPKIYHGYFCRRTFLESAVSGDAPYERTLLCPMHARPDKTFLPNINKGTQFWSIQQSKACTDQFHTHLLFGVSVWQDRDDESLLQVEIFKCLRDFDDDWDFEISAQPLLDDTPISTQERFTFELNKIEYHTFIERIIRYLAGTRPTF